MRLRYNTREAAEALSVSPRKLEDLIKEGAFTVHQDTAGGPRYISARSLEQYIQEREEMPVVGRLGRRKSA